MAASTPSDPKDEDDMVRMLAEDDKFSSKGHQQDGEEVGAGPVAKRRGFVDQ